MADPASTLRKITKHLSNPKKTEKCAKLVHDLLLAEGGMALDILDETLVLNTLDLLIKSTARGLQALYEAVLGYYAREGFVD